MLEEKLRTQIVSAFNACVTLPELDVLCSEWNQIRKNCKLLVDWQI